MNAWFACERVSRPGGYRLDRILRSARTTHDDAALQRVANRLDAGMRERLDALLADDDGETGFARLAADPGRVGLESLLAEIAKLERLRGLDAFVVGSENRGRQIIIYALASVFLYTWVLIMVPWLETA